MKNQEVMIFRDRQTLHHNIYIISIIMSIKNSLRPWQSPEYLGPMGKKDKNHYRTNIRSTIKHGDMIHLFRHHPLHCFHLLVARSLSYITIRITRDRACESEISKPSLGAHTPTFLEKRPTTLQRNDSKQKNSLLIYLAPQMICSQSSWNSCLSAHS